jgi:hypothetical protein
VWQVIPYAPGQRPDGRDTPPLRRMSKFWNVEAGIEGGIPFRPWAAELREKRVADNSKDNPALRVV